MKAGKFQISQNSIKPNGFTLVELLVALSIFSFLSIAGVTLLRSSVDTQSAVTERLSDTAVINRLSSALTADLAQIAVRPSRDENGSFKAVFDTKQNSFTFIRAGRSNGLDDARSELQKIAYRFDNNILLRVNWPMIDGSAENAPAPLVTGLSAVTMRYRALDGSWRDDWSSDNPLSYPRALEITLQQDGLEPLIMRFMVGPQSRDTPEINLNV